MIGPHADVVYQKLIFTFFLSILSMNIIGLLPFGFTPTSHIIITFFMAFIIFLVCVGISIAKHKLGFFAMFVPKGTPLWMMPLMFVLEIFSYLARPMSLSIRLAANMIAGHVMLDVIAYFAILMGIFGLLPFGVPGFFQVGVLPIVVGLTMWLQQITSYSGPQNEYTKVMKYMPIFFTFLFASFPAGLMIYWSINNLFIIANQYVVSGKK